MNAEPHTHNVRIGREYGSAGGHRTVEYGDTTVKVRRWWYLPGCFWTSDPSEKLVRRAVEKAVRRHDKGSLKAGKDERLVKSYENLLRFPEGRWGSDVLSGFGGESNVRSRNDWD